MEVGMEMETGMEEGDDQLDYFNFWDSLKRKLDCDMPPEDLKEFVQLLGNKAQLRRETDLASDVLTSLEQDKTETEALAIVKHVLGEMRFHHNSSRTWSYVSLIEEYEQVVNSVPRNEDFVGRERDLKEILQMFSASSNIVGYWIHGLGGMGKTTLVQEVCSRVVNTFNIHIVNLRSSDKFADMLKVVLHKLGGNLGGKQLDVSERDMKIQLFDYIDNVENDTLVVFDNIEDIYKNNQGEVECFIEDIIKRAKQPQTRSKVKLIFTSRLPIENYNGTNLMLLNLQPLTERDVEKLLLRLTKTVNVSKEKMGTVFSDGIPLSIKLKVNHLLQCHESGLPVNDEYLHRLSAMGMEDCINYEFENKDETRRQTLAMLMIFETSPFDIDEAAAALGELPTDSDMSLSELIKDQLIHKSRAFNLSRETIVYTFHPVILASLEKIVNKLPHLKQCQITAKKGVSKLALKMIDRECRGNFNRFYTQVIHFVFESRTRIDLLFSCLSDSNSSVELTEDQLDYLRYIPPVMMTYSKRDDLLGRTAESYLTKGNYEHYWYWSMERAKMCLELNQFSGADKTLVDTVENTGLRQLLPHEGMHAKLKAEYYLTKGRILRGLSRFDEALNFQLNALTTLQEYAEDDIPRLAEVFNAIGNIYHSMDDLDESYTYHKKAVDVMESYLNGDSTPDMSVYIYNLGTISFAKGVDLSKRNNKDKAKESYEEALVYYDKSIKYDENMKLDNKISYSNKLKIRAKAYRGLKEYEKAIGDAKKSVKIKEKLLMDGPKEGLILGYYQVAELYLRCRDDLIKKRGYGETSGAKDELKESLKWFTKAATLIIDSKENGLSPDHDESPSFALDYEHAASAMSDTIGRDAKAFCREFLSGDYFKEDTSSSSDGEDGPPSPDSMSGVSDDDNNNRKDSGLADSLSSMDPIQTGGSDYRQFSFDRQSSGQDDDVFMESDTVIGGSGSVAKRKRTVSD